MSCLQFEEPFRSQGRLRGTRSKVQSMTLFCTQCRTRSCWLRRRLSPSIQRDAIIESQQPSSSNQWRRSHRTNTHSHLSPHSGTLRLCNRYQLMKEKRGESGTFLACNNRSKGSSRDITKKRHWRRRLRSTRRRSLSQKL